MDTQRNESITIVSKSGLFRNGLKSLLSDSSFAVIDEVQTIDHVDRENTGIVLIDAGVAQKTLVEDIQCLTKSVPERPVVVLADVLEWSNLVGTISAGASGFLLKDISTEALVGSLKLVMLGEKVFPTHMTTLLLRGVRPSFATPSEGDHPIPDLSQRENEILRYLVEGDSNKMIARRLDVTEATVKVHMKSLMRKLKCCNRTQAAIWALNHGFNDVGDDGDDDEEESVGNGGGAQPSSRSPAPRKGDAPRLRKDETARSVWGTGTPLSSQSI